jgi:hypothetical protein
MLKNKSTNKKLMLISKDLITINKIKNHNNLPKLSKKESSKGNRNLLVDLIFQLILHLNQDKQSNL